MLLFSVPAVGGCPGRNSPIGPHMENFFVESRSPIGPHFFPDCPVYPVGPHILSTKFETAFHF
jgi:hypothetical protein